MEVTAVEQAQVALFIPTAELNLGGRVSVMNLAQAIAERYKFAKFPKNYEEWAAPNGTEFALGRFNDVTISKLLLFVNGIAIDTASSTDDSERVLEDMFSWASERFGVRRPPDRTPRWYSSAVVFVSDLSLDGLHPAISGISNAVSQALANDVRKTSNYEAFAIWWNLDEYNVKFPPGAFRLERRVGIPFDEKKWWSMAPLPTKKHLELLSQFETAAVQR